MRPDFDYDYDGSSTKYDENPLDGSTPSWFYYSKGTLFATGKIKLNFPNKQEDHQVANLSDTYKIFSYAAHAWGEPIGMLANVPDFTPFNLQNLGYDEHHYSHSRQFRSNIIAEWKYWSQILEYIRQQ